MGKPILYFVPSSPCARAALLTSIEIGLDVEVRNVNMLALEHRSPEYLKKNPFGKIPTLVDEDLTIWDSHAICMYLVEKYANGDKLYPKELNQRTKINQMLFFEGTNLFQKLYEIIIPIYTGKSKEIPQKKISEVNYIYGILENFLSCESPYLCGPNITIADLSVWPTILSMRPLVPIDANKFPKLEKWLKLLKVRPCYEINQHGANEFWAYTKAKIEGTAYIPVPTILNSTDD